MMARIPMMKETKLYKLSLYRLASSTSSTGTGTTWYLVPINKNVSYVVYLVD